MLCLDNYLSAPDICNYSIWEYCLLILCILGGKWDYFTASSEKVNTKFIVLQVYEMGLNKKCMFCFKKYKNKI